MPTRLALVGPTATAKSMIAIELARRLPGGQAEIVTADSMQVYRGMDIGTAKPTAPQRLDVPHHLLDIADPAEDFSVVRYQRAATDAICEIEARGHRVLLVGGTGLYVQAVVDRLEVPGQWPEVRADLEREVDTSALWERLHRLDPSAAARMEPGNRRRIVRALEVTVGSGRPFSSFGPGMSAYPPTAFKMAAIALRPEVARTRVVARFQAMLDAGLVDEARRLSAGALSRTARQALGYKELWAYLSGETSLDEAVETAVRRTVWFARRQRRWFRRDPRIVWYEAGDDPVEVLPALLRDWERCG